jgi:hypothetical protein
VREVSQNRPRSVRWLLTGTSGSALGDIGMLSDVYLGRATVSFYNAQQEEQANISATGAWSCSQINGGGHEPVPTPTPAPMTSTVNPSYGTLVNTSDTEYTSYCPNLTQVQSSSWSVSIVEDYALASGSSWYAIQPLTQSASETSSGGLTITKTSGETCSTTVASATSHSYPGGC